MEWLYSLDHAHVQLQIQVLQAVTSDIAGPGVLARGEAYDLSSVRFVHHHRLGRLLFPTVYIHIHEYIALSFPVSLAITEELYRSHRHSELSRQPSRAQK